MDNGVDDKSINTSAKQQTDKAADESYISHNFEAMNRAIDTQVNSRFELNELYRYQPTSRLTLMFLHITTGLSVLAVTSVLIWWLISPSTQSSYQVLPTPNNSAMSDKSTEDVLSIISKQEQPDETERIYIDTSFTVFHRTLIPSGEYVVTGKTYQPDQLSFPDDQYCYLEKTQSSEKLSGLPLASINKGDFTLETDIKELISFARKYCQFSKN
mgnify:CR=1 FL=1